MLANLSSGSRQPAAATAKAGKSLPQDSCREHSTPWSYLYQLKKSAASFVVGVFAVVSVTYRVPGPARSSTTWSSTWRLAPGNPSELAPMQTPEILPIWPTAHAQTAHRRCSNSSCK